MPFRFIFRALWLILAAYWLVTAFGNKPTAQRGSPAWRLTFLLSLLALAILVYAYPHYFRRRLFGFTETEGWTGVVVCASGVAVAIWARATLGTNWSGNPTIKEGHELVERGPYRLVRHPIYTGILLAIAGTLIASGTVRDVVLLVYSSVALWTKLRVEESLMMRQFPQAYADYRKRTKALIPFVL